jgi:hypothetical protein
MNRATPGLTIAPTKSEPAARNSPLIGFALRGLEKCWLAEHGRWSHIYHLDGRPEPNESRPHSDVFYTLNVLLGLSRVAEVPADLNIPDIFRSNAALLTRLPVRDYALGMALWASAELGLELDAAVTRKLHELLGDRARWSGFHAQDLGMLLTGVVAQSRVGRSEWREYAAPLFAFLSERYCGGSGLFSDAAHGVRRRYSSFATQIYLAIACYQFGDLVGDRRAIALGSSCARKLIELQGPQGEWPWFYDAVGGRVLDFYEVYSVHQYGMAPALLEWAERYGVAGAKQALMRGFEWVYGGNQLGCAMLTPKTGLSFRSQIRKGERDNRAPRILRAVANAALRRSSGLIDSSRLELRLECRSYELGWILWSFGRRFDLSALTNHKFLTVPPALEREPVSGSN